MSRIPWRVALRDAALIITGSFVFAVGVDIFEIPHGLAAGGVTGLATVFSAIADSLGFYLPVGLQTTDIVSQILARRTGMPMGTAVIIVDGVIIAFSATVFSVEQALYAAVAMFICGKVIDAVVDGPRSARAAYIISTEHAEIANEILYTLNRGCTELQARGVWSGNSRPVLLCVLGRSESMRLKQIVAEIDPEAIVIISEVHEVFGEGFKRIEG